MRTVVLRVALLGLALGLVVREVEAQEETCDLPGGNVSIRRVLQGGRWSRSYETVPIGFGVQTDSRWFWATSYLGPSGRPPGDPRDPAWRCQYNPQYGIDDDSSSAWCEGVQGDGIGEVLILPTAYFEDRLNAVRAPWRLTGLRIWAGFGKSPALFRANNRLREVRLAVVRKLAAPRGDSIDVQIADQRTFELQDLDGWQDVSLPEIRFDESFYFLALEIRSVYPGARYHDTCISGIIPVTSPVPARP
ncbi:MAG: hypothetical protein AAB409_03600 [Gemmatimonadota bacterium]